MILRIIGRERVGDNGQVRLEEQDPARMSGGMKPSIAVSVGVNTGNEIMIGRALPAGVDRRMRNIGLPVFGITILRQAIDQHRVLGKSIGGIAAPFAVFVRATRC